MPAGADVVARVVYKKTWITEGQAFTDQTRLGLHLADRADDFMKDLPSWETMTDFDENDPASTADMMRKLKNSSGTDIGMEGEEMTARLDAMDNVTDGD